ncbi:LysE family translocator [Lacihabitans lacunae]|uniref:LysE family translocator n=1 Tax=Lacihabitans lacunae TaxID=1028214 RepID=A0ABV7Z3T5_9BACT
MLAILYGLGTGFVFSLMLGTVFFALIQNSIDNGYKSGIIIALGVVFSDMLFVSAAVFGTSFLPDIPHFALASSVVGGILLLTMGLVSILKEKPNLKYPTTKLGNFSYYLVTGFLLNILNPLNFLIWVAVATRIKTEYQFDLNHQIIYFVSCLAAIFSTEVGISYTASKLKRLFTVKVLKGINQVTGFIFIIFSFKLFYEAFHTFYK